MTTFRQDLRSALRSLRRSPGFTAVAVLTLALGIGVNTAIFSVVDGVLLAPLPYSEPERLVALTATVRRESVELRPISYPDFVDWRDQSQVFEDVAAVADTDFTLSREDEAEPLRAERVEGELVSASYFRLFGVEPVLGRSFLEGEDAVPDAHPVAVISHALWQRAFAGGPDVLERPIRLNGRDFTVVGVAPAGFLGRDDDTEVWVPMMMASTVGRGGILDVRDARWLRAVARLRSGVEPAQAQRALDTIAVRLEEQFPDSNLGYGAHVVPLAEAVVGGMRPALLTLLAAVGFVLLIACVNVANLLLARAAVRRRETAIRAALGASRARLLSWSLSESLLLAFLGAAAALVVAGWTVDLIVALSPVELPSYVELGVDGRVLAFTASLALAVGLVLGLVPGLQAADPALAATLHQRGGAAGRGAGSLRSVLVVSEVALALLLLIGAGLMIRSFQRIQAIDPGFEPEGVVTGWAPLPPLVYNGETAASFAGRLAERVGGMPGVTAAAVTSTVPFDGGNSATHVEIEGFEGPGRDGTVRIYRHRVSSGYFAALGIPLLRGGRFSPRASEPGSDAPREVIVSAELARRVWGDADPVGRRLRYSWDESWMTVVGVAGDAKFRSLVRDPFTDPDDPDVYMPLAQDPVTYLGLLVRTSGDPSTLTAALRREVTALDRDVTLFAASTLPDLLGQETAPARLSAWLMGVFGGLALALAAIGVYGVLSYLVSQRRRELGVRIALGARRGDVFRLLMGRSLRLTAAGVVLGVAGAALLIRALRSQLYEVGLGDPAPLAAAVAVLVGVALAATWLPARRASRVDPVVALREE